MPDLRADVIDHRPDTPTEVRVGIGGDDLVHLAHVPPRRPAPHDPAARTTHCGQDALASFDDSRHITCPACAWTPLAGRRRSGIAALFP